MRYKSREPQQINRPRPKGSVIIQETKRSSHGGQEGTAGSTVGQEATDATVSKSHVAVVVVLTINRWPKVANIEEAVGDPMAHPVRKTIRRTKTGESQLVRFYEKYSRCTALLYPVLLSACGGTQGQLSFL